MTCWCGHERSAHGKVEPDCTQCRCLAYDLNNEESERRSRQTPRGWEGAKLALDKALEEESIVMLPVPKRFFREMVLKMAQLYEEKPGG